MDRWSIFSINDSIKCCIESICCSFRCNLSSWISYRYPIIIIIIITNKTTIIIIIINNTIIIIIIINIICFTNLKVSFLSSSSSTRIYLSIYYRYRCVRWSIYIEIFIRESHWLHWWYFIYYFCYHYCYMHILV